MKLFTKKCEIEPDFWKRDASPIRQALTGKRAPQEARIQEYRSRMKETEAPVKVLRRDQLPELLNIKEAAKVMSISANEVYRLTYQKRLRFQMIGRRKRIPVDAIAEFLAEENRRY